MAGLLIKNWLFVSSKLMVVGVPNWLDWICRVTLLKMSETVVSTAGCCGLLQSTRMNDSTVTVLPLSKAHPNWAAVVPLN